MDLVGQPFGNYRLVKWLGQGGVASVYLGEHIHIGTQAAIKIFQTQMISDDVSGFCSEVSILTRLNHPHIVHLLDFGIKEKTPYLILDCALADTLRQRHPKGSVLPLPLVVDSVEQIAGALQSAHNQRLIHRDVKPENVLPGEKGKLLLSDFGLVNLVHRDLKPTNILPGEEGEVLLSSSMVPEQWDGFASPASDQYALGIMIYEWLTGNHPSQKLVFCDQRDTKGGMV